jgi:hypothetical protein
VPVRPPISAAINGVRAVAALFCGVLAAFFAAIPLLAPDSQQSPTAVLIVAAVTAAGTAYALWPWRRRYFAHRRRSTTPVSVERHEADDENQNNEIETPLTEGTPEATRLNVRQERQLARKAAQADGHKWRELTTEQRQEYLRRVREESAGALRQATQEDTT